VTISYAANTYGPKRAAILVSALCVALLIISCRRGQVENTKVSSSSPQAVGVSVPPFATREPKRYQAERIVTTAEWQSRSTDLPPAETHVSKYFVARDGENRREEYEYTSGERVVYLENSAGHFVLLPAENIYSDLNQPAKPLPLENETEASIDLLLSESHIESIYQKLGTEELNGRLTTKYQVTTVQPQDASVQNHTTIWIDEMLGMPIRSEVTTAMDQRVVRVSAELKEIKAEVDSRSFTVPREYKKVDAPLILARLRNQGGQKR